MPLPYRPGLSQLKRQSRELQLAARKADPAALSRIRVSFPATSPSEIKLSLAQCVIAREHGFSSWPELAAHVGRRNAKQKAKDERVNALEAEAATLAERWFALAKAREHSALAIAMVVTKKKMLKARAIMQCDAQRYDAFLDDVLTGLSSPNERTRFECAHMLDIFGDARCREPLIRLMDDPVPRVRWMAMHALSCHVCGAETCSDAPEIRERIAASARGDANVQVRRQAAIALGLMKAPEGEAALREIIASEADESVVRAARWALPKCVSGRKRSRATKAPVSPLHSG